MAKNEATLEARLDRVLTAVFPTFRDVNVVHQKSGCGNFVTKGT